MELEILEPLRLYLKNEDVVPAVELLLKASSEKKLDESSNWLDQDEFRHAWLAAREIYAAMHEQASLIWHMAWLKNPHWATADLTPYSVAKMKAEDFDEPTMENAWREEWFGGPFHTKKGRTVGLYVKVSRQRVYLNVWDPEQPLMPNGWEQDIEDEEELNSEAECQWGELKIDLSGLGPGASSMLKALASR